MRKPCARAYYDLSFSTLFFNGDGTIYGRYGSWARAQRGLRKEQMALFVKGLGQYGKHGAAKNAGFQKEDVIVELDGMSARISEGELIGQLLEKHFPGEQVKAVVLRGTQRIDLALPMQ